MCFSLTSSAFELLRCLPSMGPEEESLAAAATDGPIVHLVDLACDRKSYNLTKIPFHILKIKIPTTLWHQTFLWPTSFDPSYTAKYLFMVNHWY